jgi:hypothetical protein
VLITCRAPLAQRRCLGIFWVTNRAFLALAIPQLAPGTAWCAEAEARRLRAVGLPEGNWMPDASLTIYNKVAPGAVSDGAPGQSPLGAPSHRLDALKHERAELRRQISRLLEARGELEAPSLRLAEIEAERRLLDDDHTARLSACVASGCSGPQPAPDQTRIG